MKRKGFTLVELIVVMAIISILALFAIPRYLNHTKEAHLTRIKVNIKELEQASQKYYMTYNNWPKLKDEYYTSDELKTYAERLLDKTGEEPILDMDGKYYDIDYAKLTNYIKPIEDKENYILRNPVGSIFYFDTLTEEGYTRVDYENSNPSKSGKGIYTQEEIDNLLAEGYIEVKTAEDLNNVRNNLNGKYIQTANIDLSNYSEGQGWEPIGENLNIFKGIYDGGGFVISNLTIDRQARSQVGLFYRNNGYLTNIGLKDTYIVGGGFTGSLVGYNEGDITKSYSTGLVSGGTKVGGLVGQNSTSIGQNSISYCYFIGEVLGKDDIGGLVGVNLNASITHSYSNGAVKGADRVGGLVGNNNNNTNISHSYSTSNIVGTRFVGGLVGYSGNNSNSRITYSYSMGNVSAVGYSGGLVGYRSDGTISNSYWDTQSSKISTSAGGTGKTTQEMYQQSTYQNWDFENIWTIKEGQSYPTLQWQQ